MTKNKEKLMIETIEHLSATKFKGKKYINAAQLFDECKKALPQFSGIDMEIYWDRSLSTLLDNQSIIRETWTDENTNSNDFGTKIIDYGGFPVTHFRWERKPKANSKLVKVSNFKKLKKQYDSLEQRFKKQEKEFAALIRLEKNHKKQIKQLQNTIDDLFKKNKALFEEKEKLVNISNKGQTDIDLEKIPKKIQISENELWGTQSKKIGKNTYIYAYKRFGKKVYSVSLGRTWEGKENAKKKIRNYKLKKGLVDKI